jgi:hypothetical protein
MIRMRRQEMKRRGFTALCAAYLLFVLSPHFETLSHSHAGDARAHHHKFLSAHDVALERALLTASLAGAPDAEPQSEVAPGAYTASCPPQPASADVSGLREGKAARHMHGQEDPNLLALGSQALPVRLVFAPLPRLETPAVLAAERAALRAAARAPPVA